MVKVILIVPAIYEKFYKVQIKAASHLVVSGIKQKTDNAAIAISFNVKSLFGSKIYKRHKLCYVCNNCHIL